MNERDRRRSIREVERNVAQLVERGWRVEGLIHRDEDGEPFRTEIRVSKESSRAVDKPL